MKKISEIKSYLFENHIILAFSQDWLNVFKEMPGFDVFVDDRNKIHLVSKQTVKIGGDLVCLT